ncbi:hypothetical protein [Pelolinea submarina]|uniref:4-amino-4-deoxy-L-arabinose transferase-like glycosyltransferase n=1 Tax=Pelolinea submarina TaxID=913107 RepID=A0A347ZSJ0_9CHLR|nr:hypothetical protein [Pelolinea submarina]REG11162.1 4-amino-4-deoxy-L-arabinose transferase-like glycosyltransferase [Pelolinea submarina]BBB48271.1 hypothetical protein Pelsub_P1499 [Pelolinea submarina]
MIEKLKNYDLFPLLLLALSLLIYGLFIPFLGFYWDDFPYLWFRHISGVSGVMRAIALDRPLLAAFYALPMSVMGESPWAWQLAAILGRWLFTWSAYSFLKALWPQKKMDLKWIALLLLVFPGFKQQWISVIYTHVFAVMALYFVSLTLFVKEIRAGGKPSLRMAGAILLSVACMTAVEYVAGLELLRPFIIFMLLAQAAQTSFGEKFKRTLKLWLPYLLVFVLFLIYRVFIASSVLYKVQQMDGLTSSPLATLWDMVAQQFKNLYTSTVPAWTQLFQPFSPLNIGSLFSKLYLVLLAAFIFGAWFFTRRTVKDIEGSSAWLKTPVIGALLSLLAAGLPFWAANLSPSTQFPADRVMLPFMLGSAVLVYALISLVSLKPAIRMSLFSLVFGLSAVFQVYQANLFREDWEDFEQFFQQLSWRIPALEENTLLVTDQLPLEYYSDNSLSAVFNWIYDTGSRQKDDTDMPYLLNYTESRLGHSLASLESGTAINHNYRIYTFKGSTDQMVLFYYAPPGCVHLVDPDLDGDNPLLPAVLREYAANSRDDLISADPQQNQIFFLSEAPANSWCYYYEKASLAAELGKWEEVVQLAGSAFKLDDHPNDASERIPFIEGYARTGDWENALGLSRETAAVSPLYQPMLCNLWQDLAAETTDSTSKTEAASQIMAELGCE